MGKDGQARALIAPYPPAASQFVGKEGKPSAQERLMTLELQDGSAYQGFSFGAEKSVSGELVFQTGNWTLRHCRIISQDPRGGEGSL